MNWYPFLTGLSAPQQLHIPDGFLSAPVAIIGWVLAVLTIAYALRQTREQLGERQIPLLGVLAAFIFAAQAINFPVAGGTSGHLLGGALAAIVLGPWAAVLVMTAVIALQGLLFQDGGLLVMGWNIINMGILTAFTGYLIYLAIKRIGGSEQRSILIGGAIGAWLSVEVGASATAIQLALSGTTPLNIGLPAMFGVHALIGIGEALITVGALALILRSRPDLLRQGEQAGGTASAAWVAGGLLISLIVAIFSFAASGSPDGLERVAEDHGFIGSALDPVYHILPDYTIPFIPNETVSGIVAVVLGTLVVFGVAMMIGRMIKTERAESHS
ncbi:MAG TPA: energy-coupling factor ABC transporter permease [Caldilineaceae bacterium]|nr:energy-coupling factor ABC transporter permease [Caldilineaceae bacterium]